MAKACCIAVRFQILFCCGYASTSVTRLTGCSRKPQPMIKKARKVFISDDMKQDEKYWTRRRKNNVAAKRSRDARRLKENQIVIRAGFLEKENAALRQEVGELRRELGRCKNVLTKYEAQHSPL